MSWNSKTELLPVRHLLGMWASLLCAHLQMTERSASVDLGAYKKISRRFANEESMNYKAWLSLEWWLEGKILCLFSPVVLFLPYYWFQTTLE